jgi:pyruvate/oxaloacetate carboxyltransferase
MATNADLIEAVELGAKRIANAITPLNAAPGHDATGGTVDSLTEAVMGVTAGLQAIASAIESLAEAVREK